MDKYNSWWLRRIIKKPWAVTIGQTTYYNCPKARVDADLIWKAHEDAHKMQWKRDGFWKFLFTYLKYQVMFGYSANPYELEAQCLAKAATASTNQPSVQEKRTAP